MNKPKHLENHLRSWTPRRPSTGLDRQIAALLNPDRQLADWTPPSDSRAVSVWRFLGLRLAPALACLLACLLLAGRESGQVLSILPATNAVTLAFTSNVPARLLAQTNLSADPVRRLLEPVHMAPNAHRPSAAAPPSAFPGPSQAPLCLGGQVERNVWFNGSARLARGWN